MATISTTTKTYSRNGQGLYVPNTAIKHRDDEYDPDGFETLLDMQSRHFWYSGRHRFLLGALEREMRRATAVSRDGSAVDLGGGCGGWIQYLCDHRPGLFRELALADSSRRALSYAEDVVDANVQRYQVDLLDLGWRDRWDAVFLLDVLEHIPDDEAALNQIAASLRPGGLLFVATPALQCFWSYNDDLAQHLRRYSRRDFASLARRCGLELKWSRYFMFFLSPLLVLSRLRAPDIVSMQPEEIQQHLQKTHRVPRPWINCTLQLIFAMETPLGYWLPFPWGTSILGAFRKPN